jgi:hypothetical protein
MNVGEARIGARVRTTVEFSGGYFSIPPAGTGPNLAGTTFSVNTAVVHGILRGRVLGAGHRPPTAPSAASWTTTPPTRPGRASPSAAPFSANTTVLQSRVFGDCPSGIATINANGTVVCGPHIQPAARSARRCATR